MVTINLRVLKTVLGGALAGVRVGTITVTYWAGNAPWRAVVDDEVRFALPIHVPIEAGDPVDTIELEATGDDRCARWVIETDAGRIVLERFTDIPESETPVDFGDLAVVDPTTYEPTEENLAGWQAVLDDIAALTAQVAAHAIAVDQDRVAAGTSAFNAGQSAAAAQGSEEAAALSAGSASSSAGAAASAAGAASGSAGAAATSETNAAGSASAAASSAGAAAGSASSANTRAADAETARDGAVIARTGAETAKTDAETARDLALAGQFLGTAISNSVGVDVNTLTTPGVYRFASAAATNSTNLPIAQPGILIVTAVNAAVLQTFYPVASAVGGRYFYVRAGTLSSAPWRSYLTQRNVAPASGQVGSTTLIWDESAGTERTLATMQTLIGTSTDLNTLTGPGQYYVTNTSIVTLANNFPVAGAIGTIEVIPIMAVGGALQLIQRVTNMGGTPGTLIRGIYQRRLAAGVWQPWTFMPMQRVDQTAGRAIYTWDDVNNREQLIYGDTGWRRIQSSSDPGFLNGWQTLGSSNGLYMRRYGSTVFCRIFGLTGAAAVSDNFWQLAIGWRPLQSQQIPVANAGGVLAFMPIDSSAFMRLPAGAVYGSTWGLVASWDTTDPWPTSLPGIPQGSVPSV